MLTGYHTIEDRGNPDEIASEGPFLCTRKDAWLGHGYYFWDTNIKWAHDWGKNAYRRKGYVICKASLNNDENCMWDIYGSVAHNLEFLAAFETILDSGKYRSKEEILVSDVITFLKHKGLFNYAAVRVADVYPQSQKILLKHPDKRGSMAYMRVGQRVQICLFEKSTLLLQDFKIIFPEKYV